MGSVVIYKRLYFDDGELPLSIPSTLIIYEVIPIWCKKGTTKFTTTIIIAAP